MLTEQRPKHLVTSSTICSGYDTFGFLDNLDFVMAFYETNLAVLAAVSAYLLYRQHHSEKQDSLTGPESGVKSALGQDAIKRFKRAFFPAYALVCAADWLQVRISFA
jgi:hypothetical protein